MQQLLKKIANCTTCINKLEFGARPVISASKNSKIVIIGQAPGSKVHASGIPWDDKSGDNLRQWMNVSKETFYDAQKIALIPMGFCYPGKGKTGDLPPMKECAPLWHHLLFQKMPEIKLIILVGKYAQDYYLENNNHKNLTETVKHFNDFLPKYFVLPHPSPRNNIWQSKNSWFKSEVIPVLKSIMKNELA